MSLSDHIMHLTDGLSSKASEFGGPLFSVGAVGTGLVNKVESQLLFVCEKESKRQEKANLFEIAASQMINETADSETCDTAHQCSSHGVAVRHTLFDLQVVGFEFHPNLLYFTEIEE